MQPSLDLVIIGAGQAGLAAGYFAHRTGLNFVILEAGSTVGDNWRQRYDSLVLFSARKWNQLPGMAFPGQPNGFPTKNQAADYLLQYASNFKLPVKTNTKVEQLEKSAGLFNVQTNQGSFSAKSVIIATGGYADPNQPPTGQLPSSVFQLLSDQYAGPHQVPQGDVLVVGGGHTGTSIATELATGHQVYLSTKQPLKFWSRAQSRVWFDWLYKTKIIFASKATPLGKLMRRLKIPIIGTDLPSQIESGRVKIKPPVTRVGSKGVTFSDGSTGSFQTVIWALGYHYQFDWIQIEGAIGPAAEPLHHDGISSIQGLYYVGLDWQRSRASALMGGVGRDAEFIVSRISRQMP